MLYKISKSLDKWALKGILVGAVMIILAGCISSGSSNSASGTNDAGSEEKVITGITTSIEDSGAVKIEIEGNSSLTYTSLKQLLPLSIVLYFPGTKLGAVESEYSALGDFVSAIKTSQQDHDSGYDSRIKILLNKDVIYEVSRIDNGLELVLSSGEQAEEDEITAVTDVDINEENETGELLEEEVVAVAAASEEITDDVTMVEEGDDEFELVEDETEIAIVEEEAVEEQPAEPAKKVLSVDRKIGSDKVEISITADGAIKDYDIFTIPATDKKAARIVCDLKNIEGIKTKGEHIILVNSNGVDKIRYFTYPDKMRIVVDVEGDVLKKFNSGVVSSGLLINIGESDIDTSEEIGLAEEEAELLEEEVEINEENEVDVSETDLDSDLEEEVIDVGDELDEEIVETADTAEVEEEIMVVEDDLAIEEEIAETTDTESNEEEFVVGEDDLGLEEEIVVGAAGTVVAKEGLVAVEDDLELEEEIVETPDTTTVEEEIVAADDDIEIEEEIAESADTEVIEEEIVDAEDEIEIGINEEVAQVQEEETDFDKAVVYDKGKAAWVNRIDFSSEAGGKSSIVLGTSHAVEYKENKKDDKTIHFRLYNTKLPNSRKLPFITTRFDSAVNRILPVQTDAMKNNALFIIELRESVPYFVDQQGGTLTIYFEPSSIPAQEEDKAGLPEWQEVLNKTTAIPMIEAEAAKEESVQTEDDMVAAESETVSDEASASAGEESLVAEAPKVDDVDTEEVEMAQEEIETDESMDDMVLEEEESTGYVSWAHKKKYKGEKISVDFYETDIKNVLRIIRAVSGENFAIDKDVSGKATMTLDNPVPWDQVLDLVLKMNMLGMISEGGINRIATLETLRMEEEKRLEYIAAEEKTRKKKKALEPLSTKYILINYADAKTEIQPLVKNILTEERGEVSVDERTNQIIITDTDEKIGEVLELIKKLDRITPQVIIEARIVEATTSFSRTIGTEWDAQSNENYDSYSDALGGTYGWDVAMNNSVAANSSFGINFTKLTGGQFMLNAALMAMETKGEGKIISAPKLITLDNKKATITQGYSYPYSTATADEGGSYLTTTEFVDIELKLEVTPHVTSDKKISLQISIDKDDIAAFVDDLPSISTNNIETELLIDDGDTIVIGGVVKSNKTESVDGFPILSKIPVLGWLFKSKTTSEEKQELLIFLTPRIVSFAGDM